MRRKHISDYLGCAMQLRCKMSLRISASQIVVNMFVAFRLDQWLLPFTYASLHHVKYCISDLPFRTVVCYCEVITIVTDTLKILGSATELKGPLLSERKIRRSLAS